MTTGAPYSAGSIAFSPTLTISAAVPAGTLVLVSVTTLVTNSGATITGVSDNVGNTYTLLGSDPNNYVSVWSSTLTTALAVGDVITITDPDNSGDNISVVAVPSANGAPVFTSTGASSGTEASYTTSAIVPIGEYLIAFAHYGNGTPLTNGTEPGTWSSPATELSWTSLFTADWLLTSYYGGTDADVTVSASWNGSVPWSLAVVSVPGDAGDISVLQDPDPVTASLWTESTAGGITTTSGADGYEVTFPSASTASTQFSISSVSTYSFNNANGYLMYVGEVVSSATYAYNQLVLADASGNVIKFEYIAGSLQFAYVPVSTGTQVTVASITYNAATMAWWRMSTDGTNFYWSTSPDGQNWTTRASEAISTTGMALVKLTASVTAGCFEDETNPGTFTFGMINCPWSLGVQNQWATSGSSAFTNEGGESPWVGRISPATGNTLLAFISVFSTAPSGYQPKTYISDNGHNWWRLLGTVNDPVAGSSLRLDVWMCENIQPLSVLTLGCTQVAVAVEAVVIELSGLPPFCSPTLNVKASGTNTGVSLSGSLSSEVSGYNWLIGACALAYPAASTAITATPDFNSSLASALSAGTLLVQPFLRYQALDYTGTVTETFSWGSSLQYTALVLALNAKPSPPAQTTSTAPVPKVEAAFGYQPGTTTGTMFTDAGSTYGQVNPEQPNLDWTWLSYPYWTDLTQRLIGEPGDTLIHSIRGRDYELSDVEAGELDLQLNNQDGALSPYLPWGMMFNVAEGTPYSSGTNEVKVSSATYSWPSTASTISGGIYLWTDPATANLPGVTIVLWWACFDSSGYIGSGSVSTTTTLTAQPQVAWINGATVPSGTTGVQLIIEPETTASTFPGFNVYAQACSFQGGPNYATYQGGVGFHGWANSGNENATITQGTWAIQPYYPNVLPEVPVRASLAWNGRRYGAGFSYATSWPTSFPHRQWSFTPYTGKDVIGVTSQGSMPSAFGGEVLADGAYAYFPLGEFYDDPHGFLFSNYSRYNTKPAVGYSPSGNGNVYPSDYALATGAQVNMAGDSSTGIGVSTISDSDYATGLPSGVGVWYYDTNLPSLTNSTWELWTVGPNLQDQGGADTTNMTSTLLNVYGSPYNYYKGLGGGIVMQLACSGQEASGDEPNWILKITDNYGNLVLGDNQLSGGTAYANTAIPSAAADLYHIVIQTQLQNDANSTYAVLMYVNAVPVYFYTFSYSPAVPIYVRAFSVGTVAAMGGGTVNVGNWAVANVAVYNGCIGVAPDKLNNPAVTGNVRVSEHYNAGAMACSGDDALTRLSRLNLWSGMNVPIGGIPAPDYPTTSTLVPDYPGGAVPNGIPGTWDLVFDDEFNGTAINTGLWDVIPSAQNGTDMYLDGDGHLVMMLGGPASNEDSNELDVIPYSLAVGDCMEARIQMPGSAANTMYNHVTFWAAGPDWPEDGEEDVIETMGWAGGDGGASYNYHDPDGQIGSVGVPGTWSNAFHTFGLYRGATSCQVYYDGTQIASFDTNDLGQPQTIKLTQTAENTDCGLGGAGGAAAAGSAGYSNGAGGGGGASNHAGGAGAAGKIVILMEGYNPVVINSGSGNWTCPGTGAQTAHVMCWGGGGGGDDGAYAQGGGGGEFAAEPSLALTGGSSYAYSVGAGGAGATTPSAGGAAGGNTTFAGNSVTVTAHGGGGGGSTGSGLSGRGSTNTVHYDGGDGAGGGAAGSGNGNVETGGGGGGAAGDGGTGNAGTSGTSSGAGGTMGTLILGDFTGRVYGTYSQVLVDYVRAWTPASAASQSDTSESAIYGDADQIQSSAMQDAVNYMTTEDGSMCYAPPTALGELFYQHRVSFYNQSPSVTFGDEPVDGYSNTAPGFQGRPGPLSIISEASNEPVWTAYGASGFTQSKDMAAPGEMVAIATASATLSSSQLYVRGGPFTAVQGQTYRCEGYVKVSPGITNIKATIDWQDDTGAYISSAEGAITYPVSSTTGGYYYVYVEGQPPSNAATGTYGPTTAVPLAGATMTVADWWITCPSSPIPFEFGSGFGFDDTYVYNIVASQRTISTGDYYYEAPGGAGASQEQYANYGVDAIVEDSSSEAQYFARGPLQLPVETTEDQAAYDRANWALAKYRQPKLRANQISVDASAMPEFLAVLLSVEQGDIVTVSRQPAGFATPVSVTCVVQKVEMEAGPNLMTFTFTLAPYFPENAALQSDASGYNVLGNNALAW